MYVYPEGKLHGGSICREITSKTSTEVVSYGSPVHSRIACLRRAKCTNYRKGGFGMTPSRYSRCCVQRIIGDERERSAPRREHTKDIDDKQR